MGESDGKENERDGRSEKSSGRQREVQIGRDGEEAKRSPPRAGGSHMRAPLCQKLLVL